MKNQSVKLTFLIVLLFLLSFSCGKSKFKTSWYLGNFSNNSSLNPSPITLSNFQISNIAHDGLDISFDYAGDDNENASVVMYYCSNNQSPGCNPLSEESTTLVRNGSAFIGNIDLNISPSTPGDILKYRTISTDIDGSAGGARDGYIIIPYSDEPRAINQLGYITLGGGLRSMSIDRIGATIVVDDAGNTFIAGNTEGSLGELSGGGYDAFVVKLNSNGALDTTFGGGDGIAQLGSITIGSTASSGNDYVTSITMDNSGNIFVGGYTNGDLGEANGGNYDAFVIKLDLNGIPDTSFGGGDGIVQLGDVTINSTANDLNESVQAITLDNSGNIFIGGYTGSSLGETNGGNYDAFAIKLNSNGALDTTFGGGDGIAQLGDATVGGTADDGYDYVTSIAVDDSGNILIAGYTGGSLGETNGGNEDAFIAKLSSAGALDTTFGGGDGIAQFGDTTIGGTADDGYEYIKALTVDNSGNIFLAGHTSGSFGETSGGSYDVFVIKLDSTGTLDTTFGGGNGIAQLGDTTVGGTADDGNDSITALVLVDSENIFIAGHTNGSLGEANGGGYDVFVAKLNSNGSLDTTFSGGDGIALLGDVTISGTANDGTDYARALAIDGSGNIILAGNTNGSLGETSGGEGANYDVFAVKLDSTGALDTTFGGGDGITQLGNITVGNTPNSKDDQVTALAVDSSGNTFMAGQTNGSLGETNGGGYDVFVVKLDSAGALDTTFGGGDGIAQLGDTTVGGTADDGNDYVIGIVVDGSGNIFIAGTTAGSLGETNGGSNDAFVVKLDSTGALDATFGGGDGIAQLGDTTIGGTADDGDDSILAFFMDSGNIFIAGSTSGSLGETNGGSTDVFVAKLNSTGALDPTFGGGDGITQLGDTTVGGTADDDFDSATALFVDSFGDIFITGYTIGSLGEANGGSNDIFVAKLDSNGALDLAFGGGDGITQLGDTTIGGTADDGVDFATSLFIDSGNIFIAGWTDGSLGETNGGAYDTFVVKLDSNGALDLAFGGGDGITQLGDTTIGGTADNGNDFAQKLFVDSTENIFVAGNTLGSLGETNGGSYDAFVVKLNSVGALDTTFGGSDGIAQLGDTTIGGASDDGDEQIKALAVDDSGNIFIAGYTTGSFGEITGGNSDAFIVKLDSDGELSPAP